MSATHHPGNAQAHAHLGQKLVLHYFRKEAVTVAPLFLQSQLFALDLLQPLIARNERERERAKTRTYAQDSIRQLRN
jgi:hypothetical protein